MKKCKHCQSEIDSQAKICPNCRKKQGIPTWIIVILIIIVVPIIIGSLSGEDNDTNNDLNYTTPTTQIQEKFTLEDGHTGAPDEYNMGYYIEGYIKNNTNKEYSYVQVTFNVYDANGNQLGTAIDNINNLEANGRWKFKAMSLSDVENIASYKLIEITGF